jgi:acetyl esterase/lipase
MRMSNYASLLACVLTLAASPALAQPMQMPVPVRIPAPAEPGAIPLYAGVAPGSEGARQVEVWTHMLNQKMVRNVTRPTLTPVLPKRGKANGAAVLVIPGGGFQFVSMENEGWPVARWLADRGIAAFILKYRLEETPDSEADFGRKMAANFAAPRTGDWPPPELERTIALARADAQTALRLIRSNATRWGVDPARVGMLGFSAGARTAMVTTLADAPDARPDFVAPIYGPMTAVTPPPHPQPMFAAMASDDPLFNKQGFGLIETWQKAGGSVEFHYYQGGNHGFGSQVHGTTSDHWFEHFMAWMKAMKLLDRRSANPKP